jgi:hypothetical protein
MASTVNNLVAAHDLKSTRITSSTTTPESGRRHRALDDARTRKKLFQRLKRDYTDSIGHSMHELSGSPNSTTRF